MLTKVIRLAQFLTGRGKWKRRLKYRRTSSFQEAAGMAGLGYLDETIVGGAPSAENGNLADKQAERAPATNLLINLPDFYAPFLLMMSHVALERPSAPLCVLDFGGAMGGYASYASAMLGQHLVFDWNVVETEMYVRRGREVRGSIRFYTSIDDLPEQPRIAMFNGALQYVENWRDILVEPKVLAAEVIYISRTPIGPEYVPFLQTVLYDHGTVSYPGAILPAPEISACLSATHELWASWAHEHFMDKLGIVSAPAMIWRKKPI